MKVVIALAFLGIVGSLGSALFFMMRDKGRTRNTVRALALRVGLSIGLFVFLLVSHQLGWIEANGIPVGPR
ncbi:MAG TPA: twin transmembrane helix small protein [Burkholderiaceae bacterium]|nr:twin transmembrane helix small protein [Burkholderiaceae bacterium]